MPAPETGKLDDFKKAARQAAQTYMRDYTAYFERHKARVKGAAMQDPRPAWRSYRALAFSDSA